MPSSSRAGINSSTEPQEFTQETWTFDNDSLSWAPVRVNSPEGDRSYHDIASDTCNKTAVMFDKPATTSGVYPTWILK